MNWKKIILIILLLAVPAYGAQLLLKNIRTTNANRLLQSSNNVVIEAPAITANRALISSATGIPTHSSVTNTELGYLSGVTSNIQTQIDGLGGGGGTPGGSDTQIQFNDGGSFGGDANLTYAKTTDTFTSDRVSIYRAKTANYWGGTIPTIEGTGTGSGGLTTGNFPAWQITSPDSALSNGTSSIVVQPGNATGSGANADGGGIFLMAGGATDALAQGGDVQINIGENGSGLPGNMYIYGGQGSATKSFFQLGNISKFKLAADNLTNDRMLLLNSAGEVATSTVSLGTTGAISNQLTADVVGLTLRANTSGQTAKVFELYRSNGDRQFWIDNNGSFSSGGDATVNNLFSANSYTVLNFGVAGQPAYEFTPRVSSQAWSTFAQFRTPRADVPVMRLQAESGQTANIFENRDSTPSFLSGFDRAGNYVALEKGSAPVTPATNQWKFYFKSDGPYVIDDAGVESSLNTSSTWSTCTLGWTAVTTAPTYVAAYEHCNYSSSGKLRRATYDVQISSGTGGSGVYKIPVPGGGTIDTAKQRADTSCNGAIVGKSYINQGGTYGQGYVGVFDSTHLCIVTTASSVTMAPLSSSYFGFADGKYLSFTIDNLIMQ